MTASKILADVKYVARHGYAWPGGYTMYVAMHDGEVLCPACAKSEFKLIAQSTISSANDGWRALGSDVYYEGPTLHCAHCSGEIESAYGDPYESGAT